MFVTSALWRGRQKNFKFYTAKPCFKNTTTTTTTTTSTTKNKISVPVKTIPTKKKRQVITCAWGRNAN